MALTINVTLEDDQVQRFLDLYNQDAGQDLTLDMLNQNVELCSAIGEDMVNFWFEALEDSHAEDSEDVSAYDLYSNLVDFDIVDEIDDDDEDHN